MFFDCYINPPKFILIPENYLLKGFIQELSYYRLKTSKSYPGKTANILFVRSLFANLSRKHINLIFLEHVHILKLIICVIIFPVR